MKIKDTLMSSFLVILYLAASGKANENQNSPFSTLQSGKFYFIPLDSIQIDRTSELSKEFSDSFFCEATNRLLQYYLSQKFIPVSEINNSNVQISSLVANSAMNEDSLAVMIKGVAGKSGSEYVIMPYSCSLQQRVTTQKRWRDGRGGPSYERPIKNTAIASVHLRVWDKNGKLICEHSSEGKKTKPMFYTFFRKRVKFTEVVSYSRKAFANPLLRALNEAARELLK